MRKCCVDQYLGPAPANRKYRLDRIKPLEKSHLVIIGSLGRVHRPAAGDMTCATGLKGWATRRVDGLGWAVCSEIVDFPIGGDHGLFALLAGAAVAVLHADHTLVTAPVE